MKRKNNLQTDMDRVIYTKISDDLLSMVLTNKATPEEMATLIEIGGDSELTRWTAQNTRCPPETLKKILERKKLDGVSVYAYQNPMAPANAKIRWEIATGYKSKKENKGTPQEVQEETKDEFQDIDDWFGRVSNQIKKRKTGKAK